MQTLGLGFTWEQLSPGQRFRTLNRTITETDLVMFTGVTGMLEAIFVDRTFAAGKGAIQGAFVPAALTYSLIEGLLCQTMIQGTGLAMLELTKKVVAPVRVGDTVHGEIEVTSVRPTSKGNRGIVVSRIDVMQPERRGGDDLRSHPHAGRLYSLPLKGGGLGWGVAGLAGRWLTPPDCHRFASEAIAIDLPLAGEGKVRVVYWL